MTAPLATTDPIPAAPPTPVAGPEPPTRDRRTLKKRLVWTGILLLGAASSAVVWTNLRPSTPGEGFVSGNGRLEATEIDVATKLAGRVREILVNDGDFVEAGQPLAQMEIQVLDARRAKAGCSTAWRNRARGRNSACAVP